MSNTSEHKQELLSEYCVSQNEQRIVFAAPITNFYVACGLLGFFICMALFCFGIGFTYSTTHGSGSLNTVSTVLGVSFLLMATLPLTGLGVSQVTFDLKDRTYERVVYGPPIHGYRPDEPSIGNPFRRKTFSGPMEDIAGIRIVARRSHYNLLCAIHIEWADAAQPSMVVGRSVNKRKITEQASEIARVLALPLLKTDDPESWG